MLHIFFLVFSFFHGLVFAQKFSDEQIQQIVANLAASANHSWELGTRAQAMLELNAPFYSVFTNTSLPPPHTAPSSARADLTDVIGIARYTLSNLTNATLANSTSTNSTSANTTSTSTTSTGTTPTSTTPTNTTSTSTTTPTSTSPPQQPLVANDGAAGDPASIGVAVLLANWTGASDANYSDAATKQLEHLLTFVPKTNDGAISHRESQVQLWSDFVYMVPPFLAYYGVITQNRSVLAESYNQIRLYRQYLRDSHVDNLWRHITLGTATDDGHWSTGNGWVAAGILRVLATFMHSNFANEFQNEQVDLKNWAAEVINGMYKHRTKDNLFYNYADNTSTFEDASSTALLAAATYRLAVLTKIYHNLPFAEKSRKTLSNGTHIDSDGWLTPVVNPLNMGAQGSRSPEGQAFVVEMHAAWQDWVAVGSPGANAAARGTPAVDPLLLFSTVCAVISVIFST